MGLREPGVGGPVVIARGLLEVSSGLNLARLGSEGEEDGSHLAENKSLYKIIFYLRSYTCSSGLYRF